MKTVDVEVPSNTIRIAPLGDVQYGNPSYSRRAFTKAVDRVARMAESDPTYVLGQGDYIDAMSPSNRDGYRAAGIYSSSKRLIQARMALPLADEFLDLVDPIASAGGEWVTLTRGHHYMDLEWEGKEPEAFLDEIGLPFLPSNTDSYIAAKLGAAYIPSMALVNFRFLNGNTFRVLHFHGQGGGASPFYGLNKAVKQVGGWDAIDMVAHGHTHRVGTIPHVQLYHDDVMNEIRHRNVILVNTGSFLRSFLNNDVTYVEEKGLTGVALGHVVVSVRPDGREFEVASTVYV